MIENLRYAVMQLFRAPTCTIVTILTLALGVGANTAIFSVIRLSHGKMPTANSWMEIKAAIRR